MKKILLSLYAVVSIVSADQSENEAFCGALNTSSPSIVKVGLDTFAIRDGKASKCEDYSQEEWKNILTTSPVYAYLIAVETSLSTANLSRACAASLYDALVNRAASSKAETVENMRTIADKIVFTPGMTAECSEEINKSSNAKAKIL